MRRLYGLIAAPDLTIQNAILRWRIRRARRRLEAR